MTQKYEVQIPGPHVFQIEATSEIEAIATASGVLPENILPHGERLKSGWQRYYPIYFHHAHFPRPIQRSHNLKGE